MTSLRLNHYGDKIVAIGSVTGNRYEWIRPNQLALDVDERDVPELLTRKYKQGCDCSKYNGSFEAVQYLSYFEMNG